MDNQVETLSRGDGHGDEKEIETQEQLQTACKKLGDLTRSDGSLVSLTKQDLSLLQWMLRATSEEYREQSMWRMCDFCDEDEALDHVAAYYEAKDLGMDTSFNVAFMFALTSANRKGLRTNLMALISDTLQHGKWVSAQPKGKDHGYTNPRSPLSS